MEKALTGLVSWIDARLPLTRTWNTHMAEYYAPKNFNLWYFFGVFSLLVLVNQQPPVIDIPHNVFDRCKSLL